MQNNIFSSLNKEQYEAVTYATGPSIILAGAGSGKTRVLTYKAMYLLDKMRIAPENILMLTFTNKAAHEMKERIQTEIAPNLAPAKITATTFHSFAAILLRRFGLPSTGKRNFVIFDDSDQKDLLKELIKDSQLKIHQTPSSILYKISNAKNQLIRPEQITGTTTNFYEEIFAALYAEYQKRLELNNALDFDDLLNETVYLLQKNPNLLKQLEEQYQYLLIDEYQDTNHSQYMIAKTLAIKNRQISIVGDFSQSIYSWRGADFHNLEKFQEDFKDARVFSLEQNYRSTQPILDFAFKIISQNTTHPILKLWTDKQIGEEVMIVPQQTAEDEALFVLGKIQELNLRGDYNLEDFVILYRTNAQSRIFEEICLNQGVPYKIFGGVRFYDRKEIKDLLAFLRYLHNKDDKVSLKRIEKLGKRRSQHILKTLTKLDPNSPPQTLIQDLLKNTPYLELFSETDPEDLGRLENIQELVNVSYNYPTLTQFLDTVSLIETGYEMGNQTGDKISLMTLHAVKGLEFAVVFIVGLEEGILPHSRSANSLEELEEERRLFYVGITRAKERLYLLYTNRRLVYGRLQFNLPSQFLGEQSSLEY